MGPLHKTFPPPHLTPSYLFTMSAMTAFVAVAPKVVKTTEAKAAPAPAKAYVGLKPATLFNKAAAPEFTVSNGTTTTAVFKVWTPINNKCFETLSFLPSLSDAEIAKQVNYIIAKGWNPCIEFSEPENALTLTHGNDGIVSSATCGYYSNRYWPMWKLPMFGCTDPNQVLAEIAACKSAFPGAYIRVCGFCAIKQCQMTSMLVHRPPGLEAIPAPARSVDGAMPTYAPPPPAYGAPPPPAYQAPPSQTGGYSW